MDAEQAINRGRRAAHELQETDQAFRAVRDAMIAQLVSTSPENEALILKLHGAIQSLGKVQTALREVIDNGRLAEQAMAVSGLNRA